MSNMFHIDPNTLSVVRTTRGFGWWMRRSGIYLLEGVVMGLFFFYLFIHFFPSPEQRKLRSDRDRLEAQLHILQEKQVQTLAVLDDLQERDANLYRVLFLAEPLSTSEMPAAVRRMRYYEQIGEMTNSELAGEVTLCSDRIEDQLYAQTKSFEDLYDMAKNQEDRKRCIPAIQPVLNKDLKRMASGYGIRIDPVYHVKKFHQGIDFAAPIGTDIMAPGDGKVTFVGWKQGYGNTVIINHGYGYSTLYGHLYKSVVTVGQKVKRGDIIALVGSTGKSTGPHLHYEVRVNDRPVDPRNYFFYDLDPEAYDRMIQITNNYGTIMD